ncbi:hypothetical protein Y032_0139g2139 [Ancylostoma ceylanicum]|uniref:Uncharacterized protein n=1 Tax=Ancylostoma ceylanicum TaxID=53326 RepID=A0A016T4I2_9BILA|nr:hypothetical protein Y032_0139g2139 [Ancylostoma ceylanicum]
MAKIDEVKLSVADLLENLKSQIDAAMTYIASREEQSERERLMKNFDDSHKTEAYELNLDESINTNAHSRAQGTLLLESDVRDGEGSVPQKMMAEHSKCKDVLSIDASFPRDCPSDCSYASETYTPQKWPPSVVRDVTGLPKNNDHDQPALE